MSSHDAQLHSAKASPVPAALQPLDAGPAAPPDFAPAQLRPRHDGWTGMRQRAFVEALADTGIVERAARAAGMSVQSAYALRRRGEGRAFSLAWDAALRLARQRLVDTAWTRALEGQEEDIVSGGQVTGTRTRIDNRLLIFLINRADRGFGTGGELLVNIANEYDSFVDAMEQDAETLPEPLPPEEEEAEEYEDYEEEEEDETEYTTSAAADFLRARQIAPYEMRLLDRLYEHKTLPSALAPDPAPDPAPHPAPTPPAEGTAPDIDISDLDPADMHRWTLDQWERAYHSGLTEKLLAEWEGKEDETCPPQP